MTTPRMRVLGWTGAFAASLGYMGAVIIVWLMQLAANAGGLHEGLGGILSVADTSVVSLPGMATIAATLTDPSFRAFSAGSTAWGIGLVEVGLVHLIFKLLREWATAKNTPLRSFTRDHIGTVVALVGLMVLLAVAIVADWRLWGTRALADVAYNATTGASTSWWQTRTAAEETVADSGGRLAGHVGAMFFAITLGLAVLVEIAGWLVMHTGTNLATAIDTLKMHTTGDAFLDSVGRVIGGNGEAVTRRTALSDPRYVLHRSGRVYSAAFIEGLRRHGRASK